MAAITLTIPDAQVQRVLAAFDKIHTGRPPAITQADWAKQRLRDYVINVVWRAEVDEAKRVAEAAAAAGFTEPTVT